VVQVGLRYGMLLFILSEVCFFVAFFWAFFHSSLAPTVEIGSIWPPEGFVTFNPWEVPFLNTVILLSSGAAITAAHHFILAGDRVSAISSLEATLGFAVVFTLLQVMEYLEAPFRRYLWFNFFYGNWFSWFSRYYRDYHDYCYDFASLSFSFYKAASFWFRSSCLVLAFC
jgi:heme/copper-type cytochrome/quinol oxidase subunit 3